MVASAFSTAASSYNRGVTLDGTGRHKSLNQVHRRLSRDAERMRPRMLARIARVTWRKPDDR